MVNPASAQTDPDVGTPGQEPTPESLAPPGGETAADAAEPPEQRASLWRRLRRSPLGVAALLPALLLAAAFVASPFSGTVSQRVDQPTVTAPPVVTAPPLVTGPTPSSTPAYPGSGR